MKKLKRINVEKLLNDVRSGSTNPLDAYANLKSFYKYCEFCLDEISKYAYDHTVENYSEITFTRNGYSFSRADRDWETF